MSYSPEAIANRFIDAAGKVGEHVSPMKLQKLVYFAHGWHLGFELGPLSSKAPAAWRWGPVFPDLYQAVKHWRKAAIQEPAQVIDYDGVSERVITPRLPEEDETASALIDRVWEVYGCMTALHWSHLTHVRGGPWEVTRKNNPGRGHVAIPNTLIQEFFEKRVQASEAN